MSGLGETGQMSIDRGGDWTDVTQVDLDLTQVLALFQQVGCVTVAQRMYMSGFAHVADVQGQTKSPLQSAAVDGFSGGGRSVARVAFSGEEQSGMAMSLPQFPESFQSALRKRNVAVAVAFAAADMQEHALWIDVADGDLQTFAQTQAARIDGEQADSMIQSLDLVEHASDFLGRENDREFKLGIGPDHLHFRGPRALQSFFPEEFDGAQSLRGSLPCDFLFGFEVDEVLSEFLRIDQFGGFVVELAELAQATPVRFGRACTEGQESQIIGEGF